MEYLLILLILIFVLFVLFAPMKEGFTYWYAYYPWFFRPYYQNRMYWYGKYNGKPSKPHNLAKYPLYRTYGYYW